MNALNRYLAAVLTVIALGISVIAYNLAVPRSQGLQAVDPAIVLAMGGGAMPFAVANGYGTRPLYAVPAGSYAVAPESDLVVMDRSRAARFVDEPVTRPVRTVETVEVARAPRRVTSRRIERSSTRDWKRTAMIVGGSTATGAGVGGIFGGKKGALIGAAIAGGVSTIQQSW